MSQELALILETPVEDLVPAMLAWNNTELIEAVGQALSEYDGVMYSEDQMDAAKKDRATLNAFMKSLNDERIRIGKVYNAPYDKFKREVDEVISKVKEAVSHIDVQVKSYEDEKRRKKLESIKEYYSEVIGEFAPLIPYERIHQEKWLNATATRKAIHGAIDQIIADARQAMAAIEALQSEDDQLVKAYYFRTLNLSAALMENDRLKQERIRIAELKAKQEAEAKAKQAEPVAEPQAATPTAPQELMEICFRVEGTLDQMKALKSFLVSNNIKFSKI